MSHELRTPLNSLLILSKLLADNPAQNLTDQQVEFARTIHQAGTDLLTLISDILDLSKVEAGKMEIHPAPLNMAEVLEGLERSFRPVAEEKGLELVRRDRRRARREVVSDEQRVAQILRNLLSNALKFTEQRRACSWRSTPTTELDHRGRAVRARVHGHRHRHRHPAGQAAADLRGLPAGRRHHEPPLRRHRPRPVDQPRDRAPARRRDPRASVDGERGLHVHAAAAGEPAAAARARRARTGAGVRATTLPAPSEPDPDVLGDDREQVAQGDRVVLIADTDVDRATARLAVARAAGFKGLVAMRPATALALAQEHRPDVILLGLGDDEEPETLGRLKRDPRTRHLPVLALAAEERRHDLLAHGAAGFLPRDAGPETLADGLRETSQLGGQRVRTVLVVDDDDTERSSIAALIGGEDVRRRGRRRPARRRSSGSTRPASTASCSTSSCPRRPGFALLERVKVDERHRNVPVIIHTGKALTRREETRLKRYAESIIVKDAGLRRAAARRDDARAAPPAGVARRPSSRRMLEQMRDADAALTGRRVLIVDDDVRNVFALTSALETHGMEVVYAENGREALDALRRRRADVDLILMDIMMPELDGYRDDGGDPRRCRPSSGCPIIALTAKAMKGDREKSIAAGASDYITKPVDVDQLVSLMRVWLYGDRD